MKIPFIAARRPGATSISAFDLPAILVVILALFAGLLAFFAMPADPLRLAAFAPEQVAAFAIVDSSPQRRALLVYLALLAFGALGLRFRRPTAECRPPAWWLITALAGLLAVQSVALAQVMRTAVSYSFASGPTSLFIACAYAVGAAAFIWYESLSGKVLAGLLVLGVLLAWWPLAGGALHNVEAAQMPWVDQHLTAVFSGGDMIVSGFRFFTEVPANYGILTPLALAALNRAGMAFDLLDLVRLNETFQALTLLLFLAAAWIRCAGAPLRARLAVMLLMLLVTYPFLSMASQAVLLPNQSGYRFVMFPVAAICLAVMPRLTLRKASMLGGCVAGLALLHNLETGIAVTAGLSLSWFMIAAAEPRATVLRAFAIVLVSALATLSIPFALHFFATGSWPPNDIASGMGLLRRFGAGFGGLAPQRRAAVFFVFGHAGYVVVRALAHLMGRRGSSPASACAGVAAMLLTWAPYFANRPDDWNFWSFLALEVLLLAPLIVGGLPRLVMAGIALLMLVPNSAIAALNIDIHARTVAAMPVVAGCGAGLSISAAACTEQNARVDELRHAASDGTALWITSYPYLTWQMSRLRPLLPPLDLYAAAITETDVAILADRIAAAHPRAILIDSLPGSVIGEAVPLPMRSLHRRIAGAAGYRVCRSNSLRYWEEWRPAGTCGRTEQDASGSTD